jgi:hypothetical protein
VNGVQILILGGFALFLGGMTVFYVGMILGHSARISNHIGADLKPGKWYRRSQVGTLAMILGAGLVYLAARMAGIKIG